MLEQLFSENWLKSRPFFAFLLSFSYSIIGIASALIIFPSSPSLITIAFISLLLLPSLNQLLSHEENQEIREKKLSLRLLFKDHKDIFEIYLFLFLGIFSAYLLLAFFLPNQIAKTVFESELSAVGFTGATLNPNAFLQILQNNIRVMLAVFILSIVYGSGSILLLAWNASVWGVVIGFATKSQLFPQNPTAILFATLIPILPHLIIETIGYLFSAISGGVLSKAAIREKPFSKKFNHVASDAVIIFALGLIAIFIGAYIETLFFLS